jgi:hypothetical protein
VKKSLEVKVEFNTGLLAGPLRASAVVQVK